MTEITLRNGETVEGVLVRVYGAFEGGTRYIFAVGNREYRCVKDENENYVEYVA